MSPRSGLHGPNCLTTNCVAQMTGLPPALKQEIPVAPSLINLAGFSVAERMYAISQGNTSGGAQPAWGDCATPSGGHGHRRGRRHRDDH